MCPPSSCSSMFMAQPWAELAIVLATYRIFQTIRRTHPQLGGKWGCILYSKYSLPSSLGWGAAVEQKFFPHFPPLKPRCVWWSSASYSLKTRQQQLWELRHNLCIGPTSSEASQTYFKWLSWIYHFILFIIFLNFIYFIHHHYYNCLCTWVSPWVHSMVPEGSVLILFSIILPKCLSQCWINKCINWRGVGGRREQYSALWINSEKNWIFMFVPVQKDLILNTR